MNDPAAFYTGLVADLYAPLKGSHQSATRYAAFIRERGEPALELGCGDGEPLLDLVADGLDVEGLDSSIDMLDRCAHAATARGLSVTLHHASMAEMSLGKRYRSIFIAGPTFNLLPDDEVALASLRCIATHLTPDGAAFVPLFIPRPSPEAALGKFRETTTDDGTLLRFALLSEERDEDARTQTSLLRYERHRGDDVEVLERPWLLHWHTRDGFAALAEKAGLHVAGVDGVEEAFAFTLSSP
ncbi:MAG: class I SAM-dependent methyltransferase [Acidimicrobiales bacterium]|nr:class I SAM-dependent methyltransferase [Acidimicrobiales bacterium]